MKRTVLEEINYYNGVYFLWFSDLSCVEIKSNTQSDLAYALDNWDYFEKAAKEMEEK